MEPLILRKSLQQHGKIMMLVVTGTKRHFYLNDEYNPITVI
jgi:hypothetical protein